MYTKVNSFICMFMVSHLVVVMFCNISFSNIHNEAMTAAGPSVKLIQGLQNLRTAFLLSDHSLVLHLLHRNVQLDIIIFFPIIASSLANIVNASPFRNLKRIEKVHSSICSWWMHGRSFSRVGRYS